MASLFNLFGRTQRRKVAPTETVGHGGTTMIGGSIQENEKNADLLGQQKYVTYSTVLANTNIVSAGTRYFLDLIGKATWKIQPNQEADNQSEAERLAELVEDILYDMETPWNRVVRRAAMFRFYGFSTQEWTAKRREDGVIGLLDIAPRSQQSIIAWDTELSGKVTGCTQLSPLTSEEIYLPREKLLYLCDNTLNDSPEGLGLFRNIIEASKRLQRYEQLEGFGFETDLRGVPIGRVPYALLNQKVASGLISQEEATATATVLETFIKQHIKNPSLGLVVDSSVYTSTDEGSTPSSVPHYALDLLTGGNTTQAEVASAIERVNHEIARVLGVEHLLLGQSRGTQALSEDKSHNFAMIIDSTLTEIEESVERDIIDTIFMLNGWDPALKPETKTEQVQMRNVQQITAALSDMARAGAPLDMEDPAIAEVRDLLGLSAPLIAATLTDASLNTPKPDPNAPIDPNLDPNAPQPKGGKA